jgi:hypothetical protein
MSIRRVVSHAIRPAPIPLEASRSYHCCRCWIVFYVLFLSSCVSSLLHGSVVQWLVGPCGTKGMPRFSCERDAQV